jgi:hypothetical protein
MADRCWKLIFQSRKAPLWGGASRALAFGKFPKEEELGNTFYKMLKNNSKTTP